MQAYNSANGCYVLKPFTANGHAGEIIVVKTDLNRPVMAWRAKAPLPLNPDHRYFCHGYSLDSYVTHGYTVLSAVDMAIVLADEYNKIGQTSIADLPVLANDIIVMWGGTATGLEVLHSAKIVNYVVHGDGSINEGLTLVNSKTGTGALKLGISFTTLKQDYANLKYCEVYRRA